MFSYRKDEKQFRINSEKTNNEIMLKTILDNSPDIIYLINLNYLCTYANQKALSFLDKNLEEVVGKKITDLFQPEAASENMRNIQSVIETGENKVFLERPFLTSKGTLWLDTIIIGIKDDSGKVTGVLGHSRDITKYKQEKVKIAELEIYARKVQNLESLGVLAGGIAHEFNNLLSGILGYLENARSHLNEKDKVEDNLVKAIAVFDKAKVLTKQLLTFSKGGSPEMRTVDIREILKKTVKSLTDGTNIKVLFYFAENLKNCDIDENQITQVFYNIVLNARQSMSKGGILKVKAVNVEKNKEGYSSLLEFGKNYIEIIIIDTGTGIPTEIISKIFDPFFSTKKHGSGLGLAAASSIINRHNGVIEAKSSIKEGTSMYVYLPSSEKTAEKVEEILLKKQTGMGNILVMDDEIYILELLRDILGELGYKVNTVERSDEALEIFKNALPSKNKYEIVILDLTIPGGMGGKDIVKRMKELDPNVKAVASSGYSDDEIMARPKDFGFDASLAKPYTIEDLAKILQDFSKK